MVDRVAMICRAAPDVPCMEAIDPGIEVRRVSIRSAVLPANALLALLKVWEDAYRRVRAGLEFEADLIHCHSITPLSASVALKRRTGAKLLYDAHELETERAGIAAHRRWFDRRLERKLIRHCEAVVCVSDSIADWYAEHYGIERPIVVRNVPDVLGPPTPSNLLRQRFDIAAGELIFLYQGMLTPGRRIEQILRVFSRVRGDRHVVLMGYGELEDLVRATAATHSNVHFLPAVPQRELLAYTASADIGLVGVENVCLSYFYSLPNKLFEYLFAGLPVIAGRLPEIERVVREHQCGWLHAESDDALLELVQSVGPREIQLARDGAARVRQHYSWAAEERRLLDVYRRLLHEK
jgi:glycosyltransferase involved in cell wall biosynthesis